MGRSRKILDAKGVLSRCWPASSFCLAGRPSAHLFLSFPSGFHDVTIRLLSVARHRSQTHAHTRRRSCRVINDGCRHFLGMGERGEAKLFDPIAEGEKIGWRRLIFRPKRFLHIGKKKEGKSDEERRAEERNCLYSMRVCN